MSAVFLYTAMGVALVVSAILSVLSWYSGNGSHFLFLAVVLTLGAVAVWLEYPTMGHLTEGEAQLGHVVIVLSLLAAGLVFWTLKADPEFSESGDRTSTELIYRPFSHCQGSSDAHRLTFTGAVTAQGNINRAAQGVGHLQALTITLESKRPNETALPRSMALAVMAG